MLSKETADLLTRLRALGVAIRPDGPEAVRVEPDERLDDALRTEVAARGREIAAFLAAMAPPAGSARPEITRTSREGSLPLSFAQRRLWFLHRMGESSAAYNMLLGVRLRGPLDADRLRRALSGVVERHEALRTAIAVERAEPVQRIEAPAPVVLEVEDLTAEPDPMVAVVARTTAAAGQSFDLSRAPLFSARLLRVAAEDHVLAITMSHVIADGWSAGVLWRELRAGYEAAGRGREPALPELPIQYADYAKWQEGWRDSDAFREALAFWRDQLADLPTLDLPTDRPRPAAQTFAGDRRSFTVPAGLRRALTRLGASEGCTPFMTLLAVFDILLARYSGQEDIVVGTPVANRERVELEPLIGLFVNSVVLRTDLSGDPSFRELLRRVAARTVAAFAHQEMPFEHLVAELRPERDLSRNPLFQVLFNHVGGGPLEAGRLGEVEVEEFEVDNASSKFDLTLAYQDVGDELRGIFEFNTDLFDASTIERMAAQMQMLLASVVADPDRVIWRHSITTPAERPIVLAAPEWSPFPDDVCLHTLFEQQVARRPDAIAVQFGAETLTYAQLDARANQLARHLRELGAKPEKLIGLGVERSIFMPIGMLGILKSGAAYVPMDPGYPPERLAFMLEDASAELFVTQESVLARLPRPVARPVLLDGDAAAIARHDTTRLESVTGPRSLAHAIFSSGSTGRPKGALIEHRNLCNVFWAFREAPGITENDTLLAVTNIAFDLAGLDMFLPLIVGAKLVIAPSEVIADGRRLAALIAECDATFLDATPSMWKLLVDSGWAGKRDLRCVTGGEMMPRDLAERLAATCRDLWDCYAPCESTIYSTRYRFVPGGPLSVGKPLSNTQFYLLDTHGQPTPIGVTGDIHIGGVGLARGYLQRPELTAERFVPNPFSDDPNARLYRTGDLARWNRDGNLELVGRADQQLKLRGFRIELGEIEHALSRHAAIAECAVIAKERPSGDKQLVAFVVFAPGATASVPELRDALRKDLPEFMIPAGFVTLASLPLTPNRKVDRKRLAESQDEVALGVGEYVAPRTDMERLVAEVWREVLGVEQVGVHDNFFDLGGHSLVLMRAVFELEERTGHEVLPMDLLVDSLEQLARTLERRAGTAVAAAPGSGAAREVVRALFFGDARRLFGVYHEPAAVAGNVAVLLCPGFGHEYVAAHGSLQRLAAACAQRGMPTLRFDFSGCGDSAGEIADASIANWTEDVGAAARTLLELSGRSRVVVVGLRLGATLAALAAVPRLSGLVLWEPVVRGVDHVAELANVQRAWIRSTFVRHRPIQDRGGPQVLGFPFPQSLQAELRAVDLAAVRPAVDVLVLQHRDRADDLDHLVRTLGAGGTAVRHDRLVAPLPWIGEQGHTIAITPAAVLRHIVDWISGGMP